MSRRTDHPAWPPSFDAVFFDLDGTLVDTEGCTDDVVREVLVAQGVAPERLGDSSRYHGATWRSIADDLAARLPELSDPPTPDSLRERFDARLAAEPPTPVRGAPAALAAAIARGPAAIVTSSDRRTLRLVLPALGRAEGDLLSVCAEDVSRSKPAPDAYLLAARRLGVEPGRCLVFEDSMAGLEAARAARMTTVAIARDRQGRARAPLVARADRVVRDFTELPPGFLGRRGGGLR